jgi:hypothetical protein
VASTDPLADVTSAAATKRAADIGYRTAMLEAWRYGASNRELAAAAGVTKQAARMVVVRALRRK